jgi:hypothetical protein
MSTQLPARGSTGRRRSDATWTSVAPPLPGLDLVGQGQLVRRARNPALAAIIAIIALAPSVTAIAQVSEEPSVTVKVSPDRIPPGGSVTISGLGYAPSGSNIAITVTPPGGMAAKLVAVPDNQTRYSTQYVGANAPGTYSVSAQSGAKSTPATTQFTVQSATIDIDEDVGDNKHFLEEAQDLVKAVKKQVDNVPDSPAKTEMTAKLDKLEPALANVTQQSAQLSSMLQPFKALLAQHPETQPALQPLLDHLADLDEKTRDDSQVVAKITAQSQKTLASCDTIDQSTQALKALSEILDTTHEPFEFVTAYASGLVKSASPQSAAAASAAAKAANFAHGLSHGLETEGRGEADRYAEGSLVENGIELGSETALANKLLAGIPASVRTGDGYKFAVAEAAKFAPRVIADGDNVVKQFLNAAALATDAANYANEKFFARYCQKFEGTFTATMKAYFYATGFEHDDWWHYSTVISGKLTLRYPKDAGPNVPLSGQFEGGATAFTYDESVWTHSDLRKLAPGNSLVGHKDTAPIPADSGKGGVLASLASPTSFYIPVTGEYANGRVTFRIDDARSDFIDAYVKARTFYVVASVYTMSVPILGHFSLPYQNAHFILNHFAFDYPAVQTKDSIVIEKNDSQDRPRLPANESYYILKLKACNPACGGSKD